MAKITGIKQLLTALKKLEIKSIRDENVSVVVGYNANYAIHVHEDAKAEARRRLRAKGAGRQQWKYLEQPTRELGKSLGLIVRSIVKKGGTLIQGLTMAGLRLQRASQKLVPIDTGNLRGSAFTEREK